MTRRHSHRFGLVTALPAVILLAAASTAQALQVQSAVTDQGGFFHYDMQVLNDDPILDLIAVSITDAPLGDPLIAGSLSAPPGFVAGYDAGLGFVDFLADSAVFFPAGVTGLFSFDSSASPFATPAAFTSFQALALDGTLIDGQIDHQLVQNVAAPAPLALLIAGLGWLARRGRNGLRIGHTAT